MKGVYYVTIAVLVQVLIENLSRVAKMLAQKI